ncbi:MAG: 16S rRNA (guanine(527)-N(7))-methyltransferase RsmG [Hyphomicrobiaceae bacterium]
MKSRADNDRIVDGAAFLDRFNVSRETFEKLDTYVRLLRLWQKTINLVAPGTLDDVWHRHFADSAQLHALVPTTARTLADLGSGAGFPGLVLAILASGARETTPGHALSVTLIEADQRKCAFLREVARAVDIPVDILSTRIETSASVLLERGVDVVTARALAPLDRLCSLAAPLMSASGVCLFLKGRAAAGELAAARASWAFDAELIESMTDPEGRIVVLRRVSPHTGG